MTTFAREAFNPQLFGEILPLAQLNWAEMNPASAQKLNLDFLKYHDCEVVGALRVYTVRQNTRLVGYAAFFIGNSPHSIETRTAIHDALYVQRASRGLVGARFILWCNQQLAAEGIIQVVQTSPLARPIDRMLTRLGYKAVETLYVLDLQKGGKHE